MKSTTSRIRQDVVRIQCLWGTSFGLYIFTFSLWYEEVFKTTEHPFGSFTILLGVLAICRQGGVALLEQPAGALADHYGRKGFTALGFGMRGLFFLILALLPAVPQNIAFPLAVLSSLAFALSYASFNGAFAAWIADQCRDQTEMREVLALGHRSLFLSELLAGLVAFALFLEGRGQLTYVIGLLSCLVGVLITLWSTSETADQTTHNRNLSIKRFILIHKQIVGHPRSLAIAYLFGSMMFLVLVVDLSWILAMEDYLQTEARDYRWLVVILLVGLSRTLGSSLALTVTSRRTRTRGARLDSLRNLVILATATAGISAILISFLQEHKIGGAWALMLSILLILLAHGAIAPAYEALAIKYVPNQEPRMRAATLSLGSTIKSIFAVFLVLPSLGPSVPRIVSGWSLPGILVLCGTIFLGLLLKQNEETRV